MSDILFEIKSNYKNLSEDDIDSWIVPKLIEQYKNKILFLADKIYGHNQASDLCKKSFLSQAKFVIRTALVTFVLKKQHWKNGRDINSYILKSLDILSIKIINDINAVEKTTVLICPACKLFHKKNVLLVHNSHLECELCTRLLKLVLTYVNRKNVKILNSRYILYKTFYNHSKKGKKCGRCGKFIPDSAFMNDKAKCPYPNCGFSNSYKLLKLMNHPVKSVNRAHLSLNKKTDSGIEIGEFVENNAINSPELILDFKLKSVEEHNTLLFVIEEQMKKIRRTNSSSTFYQKLLMYEAFKRMTKLYPEDMVSYLVHRKQHSDFPIQAKIFQGYISLIKDFLPFKFKIGKKIVNIASLTNKKLSLFLGISTYTALVNKNRIIPNKTKERYIGGRQKKDYGPCFIGDIIDVKFIVNGKSLLQNVESFGFQHIKVDKTITPGTGVVVSHYRIPSHYEMCSMVWLQRIRRQIVDAVYFKLHKRKRKPGE